MGTSQKKLFLPSVTKSGGVEADVEVRTEEQQLSIALIVERKLVRKEHPLKRWNLTWGWEDKTAWQ